MIGIIPSGNKTFEVYGMFKDSNLVEDKLYIDPTDNRVYIYSTIKTRSNPDTGFFPIWDGKNKYISKFSNKKYLDNDVIRTDIASLSSGIDNELANKILDSHRRAGNESILNPLINETDNMFTQCIKGVIQKSELTIIDLMDMSGLDEKIIENYYSALNKIAFMRMDRWLIWIDIILHLKYTVIVYRDDIKLLSYSYPDNIFDTGVIKYDAVVKSKDDHFKKIIKILMVMENIDKNSLRSDDVDDYTINNMLTTLSSKKPLSAQLFSRFIKMANLKYTVDIYEGEEKIFEYKE